MDFFNLPSLAAEPTKPAGYYFVIRCEPDPFTGEQLNIGVCAIDPSGKRHVKVITEPGRLECLYGENACLVVSMAQTAAACAMQGLGSPSSQIVFDIPLPYYHTSAQDVLASAFAEQVTVAIPKKSNDTSNKNKLDDEAAWTMVANDIRLLKGLQADVIANTPQVLIETGRGARSVMVPLQPAHGAGTVRSADYSTQTLKSHLMDSLLDLDCAARYRRKRGLGMFILRPKKATVKEASAIDAAIDSIAFRAPSNLYLEVSDDSMTLAQAINSWADSLA